MPNLRPPAQLRSDRKLFGPGTIVTHIIDTALALWAEHEEDRTRSISPLDMTLREQRNEARTQRDTLATRLAEAERERETLQRNITLTHGALVIASERARAMAQAWRALALHHSILCGHRAGEPCVSLDLDRLAAEGEGTA